MRPDRQRDMTNPIVAIRSFAKRIKTTKQIGVTQTATYI
jgi:hypothetical protein